MINGIIGRKIGMTQIFAPDGTVTPVTVIKAGPCVVVQKKSSNGPDGYDAVQLGLVDDVPLKLKNVTKPMRGHFEKTGGGIPPTRVLKEFRLAASDEGGNVGDKFAEPLGCLPGTWFVFLAAGRRFPKVFAYVGRDG